MSRADLGKEPEEVSAMFDGVARRYDTLNDLLSLGRTKAWRKVATATISPKPGMKIDGLFLNKLLNDAPIPHPQCTVSSMFDKGY